MTLQGSSAHNMKHWHIVHKMISIMNRLFTEAFIPAAFIWQPAVKGTHFYLKVSSDYWWAKDQLKNNNINKNNNKRLNGVDVMKPCSPGLVGVRLPGGYCTCWVAWSQLRVCNAVASFWWLWGYGKYLIIYSVLKITVECVSKWSGFNSQFKTNHNEHYVCAPSVQVSMWVTVMSVMFVLKLRI